MKNLWFGLLVCVNLISFLYAQQETTPSSNKALAASVLSISEPAREDVHVDSAPVSVAAQLVSEPDKIVAPALTEPEVQVPAVTEEPVKIVEESKDVAEQVPAIAATGPEVQAPAVSEEPVKVVEESKDVAAPAPTIAVTEPEAQKVITESQSEPTTISVEPSVEPQIVSETSPAVEVVIPEVSATKIQEAPTQEEVKTEQSRAQRCAVTDTLECMPKGLNTVDVDAGGNWVVKRAYWEQAEKTYEKIMKLNNELYTQQLNFVQRRNESDKVTDQAFRELGFEQGQLSEILNKLISNVKLQREQQGEITEQERAFLQELKDKQLDLENMNKNLQTIDELDNALDKVMELITTQINVCRNYEQQAWDLFKAIGKELNDKKARELFYTAESLFKSVEQNQIYVTGELKTYFDTTVQNIEKRLAELKEAVAQLKTRGTDLVKEFKEFMEAAQKKDETISVEQARAQQQAEEQKHKLEARKTWTGWFKGIVQDTGNIIQKWTMYAWNGLKNGYHATVGKIGNWFSKKELKQPTAGVTPAVPGDTALSKV